MADKMIAPKDGTEEKKPKMSPGDFMRQVQAETKKIVWPSWDETVRTAIFVFIFMLILSAFFLGIDSLFGAIVRAVIGFLQ